MIQRIEGVIPVLHSPFDPDGGLDLESLKREVAHVCDAGADGMVFPGFASEWWKLSEEEIQRAARTIVEARRGKAFVLLNVTAQSTYLAVKQARWFADLGCDGLMCLPPFVVPPGPGGLRDHLRAVMGACDKPHVVQYAASLTGTRLDPAVLLELHREFPHFSSIKVDFVPTGPAVTALVDALGTERFTYLVGYSGVQLADCMRRGARGLMSGAGHVAEDLFVFRELADGGGDEAFEALLPQLNFEMQSIDLAIAVHKRLLRQRGVIASDSVRPPAATLDPWQSAALERHISGVRAYLARQPRYMSM